MKAPLDPAAWWRFLPPAGAGISAEGLQITARSGSGALSRMLRDGRERLGSARTARLLLTAHEQSGTDGSAAFGTPVRLLLVTTQQPQALTDALAVGFAIAGLAVEIVIIEGLPELQRVIANPETSLFGDVDLTVLVAPSAPEDMLVAFAETIAERSLAPVGIAWFGGTSEADKRIAARGSAIEPLQIDIGDAPIFDARFASTFGDMLSAKAADGLADAAAGCGARLKGRVPKLLVTDLDGTLWRGVLGESGGAESDAPPAPPVLNRAYARALATLRGRGIVLAIASRNDLRDVATLFSEAVGWPLSLDDFSALGVGWDDKPSLVAAVLETLGLASEHTVFIDDDPVNCAKVAVRFPDMDVRRFSDDQEHFARTLLHDPLLAGSSMSGEEVRAERYRRKADVDRLRAEAPGMDAFFADLRTVLTCHLLSPRLFPRAAELGSRVNQFVLTGYRPNPLELAARASPLDFMVRLDDAFGSHGLVGLVLASVDGDVAVVDNLMLSCRALERGIEAAMLAALLDLASRQGVRTIVGRVEALPRNKPARDWIARYMTPDDPGAWSYPLSERGAETASPRRVEAVTVGWADGEAEKSE